MFDLRERIFKELVNKKIIETDFDQSGMNDYEENIAERKKLRRQRLDKIKEKEQNINHKLFKEYFKYESPSNMYNILINAKRHNTLVNLINRGLFNFKKTFEIYLKMM